MGKKTFTVVNNDISDGFHTFEELYDHRCLLFINLCLMNKERCTWKDDYPDWFCLYYESPEGQVSYHIPEKYLYLIEDKIEKDNDYVWDGHDSNEVISRLIATASLQKD